MPACLLVGWQCRRFAGQLFGLWIGWSVAVVVAAAAAIAAAAAAVAAAGLLASLLACFQLLHMSLVAVSKYLKRYTATVAMKVLCSWTTYTTRLGGW